jgi:hypothetical protein
VDEEMTASAETDQGYLLDQLGDGLIQAGQITAAERDTFLRLNHDLSFVGNYPLLITAWGKKPNPPG